ncbi:hypothetical protein HMSSN036_25350 [Paenibacillus macerans]|nr:hypothetical protein HMSSN036_25350 [Paenibacillus macerans]
MKAFYRVESPRMAETAIYDEVIPAGQGWMHELGPGQVLRIVDLEGNQAADTLFTMPTIRKTITVPCGRFMRRITFT